MSTSRKEGARSRPTGNLDIIRRFTWEISSINIHLEELRQIWARTLGISGPQWMILMAISDLDKDDGIPVNAVSKLLHVDPSFVTTQSKLLEKNGLLRRRPSPTDARVVRLSLTEKTQKHLASLNEQYKTIKEFVFQEFDEHELTEFTAKLATLKTRLEKACIRVTLDL
ncbi:MarR family transcriptional regulator [Bradyrhizobium liaoningense]|uniref:MarR family winged helix-turn-helix transcriptional regulator n=1 Tax=Bradyrhizobium liaoningense TaxID=43992 RepID=UPI001BA45001|nr:MarR family transcriptional regulator [Bradyrhizobium liaoningense]MBR0839460.1 MarR family transcriptional regulator [Bradyrhizobium liaoningense]MBR0855700.1 MarR family transcriptional regulator [Bradyrhizobium liaoningense]